MRPKRLSTDVSATTTSNFLEDFIDSGPPLSPRAPTPPSRSAESNPDPQPPTFNPASAPPGPVRGVGGHMAEQLGAPQPLDLQLSTPDLNIHLPLSTEDLARLPHQGFPIIPGSMYDPTSHTVVEGGQDFGAGSSSMLPMAYGGPMHAQIESAGMADANVGHVQPASMEQYLDMDGLLPDYMFVNDMMSTWLSGQQGMFQ